MGEIPKHIEEDIYANLDHDKHIMGFNDGKINLKYGDYVASGLAQNGKRYIGYIVQVRIKWGSFGSDMFFMRTPDDALSTHENQSFWKLSEDRVSQIEEYFESTPDEEISWNPDLTYSAKQGEKESGFIIDDDNASERHDVCGMAITTSDDGKETTISI